MPDELFYYRSVLSDRLPKSRIVIGVPLARHQPRKDIILVRNGSVGHLSILMRDTLRIRIVSIERQIQDFTWNGGFDHFVVPNELPRLVACVDLVLDDDRPILVADQKIYVPMLPPHFRILRADEPGSLFYGSEEFAQVRGGASRVSMREERVEKPGMQVDLVVGLAERRKHIEGFSPVRLKEFVEDRCLRQEAAGNLQVPFRRRRVLHDGYCRRARPQGESPAGRRVTIVRVSVSRTVTSLEGPLAV